MKLLLVKTNAKGEERRRTIVKEVRKGISQGFLVYNEGLEMSVVDIDVYEKPAGEEHLYIDGKCLADIASDNKAVFKPILDQWTTKETGHEDFDKSLTASLRAKGIKG
ncbi:hypothetical protein C6W22_01960 [Bacillus atrophaeus]|uniref:hypothetical protein n=1 Tax=Bacillus atrophaeus TaxID=1452 RepID=UPI000D025B34|nr:hypothetical protein [Bacillus atrophaeus]PRS09623.1 hypothetical protein C6W22_01960 [Bacillus atrophaeus]